MFLLIVLSKMIPIFILHGFHLFRQVLITCIHLSLVTYYCFQFVEHLGITYLAEQFSVVLIEDIWLPRVHSCLITDSCSRVYKIQPRKSHHLVPT